MNAPLAVIRDYRDLRAAIKDRRRNIGLSQLALDEIAGVQSGYVGKIEVGLKHFGDVSLGPILGALGIVLTASKQSDYPEKSITHANNAEIERRQKMRAKGGRTAARNMNPQERRARARKAAKSRWSKQRASAKAKKGRG